MHKTCRLGSRQESSALTGGFGGLHPHRADDSVKPPDRSKQGGSPRQGRRLKLYVMTLLSPHPEDPAPEGRRRLEGWQPGKPGLLENLSKLFFEFLYYGIDRTI